VVMRLLDPKRPGRAKEYIEILKNAFVPKSVV